MGIMLICALFVGGMILGRVYPVAEDRIWIFIATLVLTLLLVFRLFLSESYRCALESWLSQLKSYVRILSLYNLGNLTIMRDEWYKFR